MFPARVALSAKLYFIDFSGLDSESTTIYPLKGGLVSLWKTIVRKLPKDRVRFKSEISDLDIETKTVKTKEGLEMK